MAKANRRDWLKYATGLIAGIGVSMAAIPFIRSMGPSERAKAKKFAAYDVNIEKLEEGQVLSVTWQRKSIVIMRRSQDTLENILNGDPRLLDPMSDESQQPEFAKNPFRSAVPEIFVVENICTHLGCAVAYSPKEEDGGHFPEGGFFCPCHGARYDHAGRVHKNQPAPFNLVVPHYEIVDNSIIRLKAKEGF